MVRGWSFFFETWLSGAVFARFCLQRLCAGVGSTVPGTVLCLVPVCLPWGQSLGKGLGTCDIPKAAPLCHPDEQGLGELSTTLVLMGSYYAGPLLLVAARPRSSGNLQSREERGGEEVVAPKENTNRNKLLWGAGLGGKSWN